MWGRQGLNMLVEVGLPLSIENCCYFCFNYISNQLDAYLYYNARLKEYMLQIVCGDTVEALSYKVEGRGFNFRWGHSGHTVVLGSTQHLTETSTRGKGGRCIGLTTLPPSCAYCLEILGTSMSWIPKGLSSPVMGQLYLLNFEIQEIAIDTLVT